MLACGGLMAHGCNTDGLRSQLDRARTLSSFLVSFLILLELG